MPAENESSGCTKAYEQIRDYDWDKDFFGWKMRDIVLALVIVVGILGFMWLVFAISVLFPTIRTVGALMPRTAHGLVGIFCSPFLHFNWGHITGNSGPLFVLGFLLALRGRLEFLISSVATILFTGIILWIVGRDHTNYLGASTLIFGWLGYLLTVAIFERPFKWYSIIVSALVLLVYAGLLFGGVVPTTRDEVVDGAVIIIAWEAHLIGLICGVFFSFFYYFLYPKIREFLQSRGIVGEELRPVEEGGSGEEDDGRESLLSVQDEEN